MDLSLNRFNPETKKELILYVLKRKIYTIIPDIIAYMKDMNINELDGNINIISDIIKNDTIYDVVNYYIDLKDDNINISKRNDIKIFCTYAPYDSTLKVKNIIVTFLIYLERRIIKGFKFLL